MSYTLTPQQQEERVMYARGASDAALGFHAECRDPNYVKGYTEEIAQRIMKGDRGVIVWMRGGSNAQGE